MSRTGLILTIAIPIVISFLVLAPTCIFVRERWVRDNPMKNAIGVVAVRNGAVTLADGRIFRPAGVSRAEAISTEEYDRALRVIVRQGVVVIRDLGDGRAFLRTEPKFYNWCGTSGTFTHWAGSYIQCPLSELLIYAGYARAEVDDRPDAEIASACRRHLIQRDPIPCLRRSSGRDRRATVSGR